MCREVRPRATLGRSAELLGLVECSENLLRLTFGHELESFTDRFRERLRLDWLGRARMGR